MLNLGYEVYRSGGLQIKFDHLGIFNVHRALNTLVLFIFASWKAATVAGIEPASMGSTA